MIILGIDPGSRRTGYGIVKRKGQSCVHVENGTLYAEDIPDYAERLAYLFSEIQTLIRRFKVDEVAIENIFYAKNVKSVQKLGEVRGTLMACAALQGKSVFEYTPLQVKSAVTGYGKAEKEQVGAMVRTLLRLKDQAEENAADALAIAVCHAHQNRKLQSEGLSSQSTLTQKNLEILKKANFYRR